MFMVQHDMVVCHRPVSPGRDPFSAISSPATMIPASNMCDHVQQDGMKTASTAVSELQTVNKVPYLLLLTERTALLQRLEVYQATPSQSSLSCILTMLQCRQRPNS